MIFRVVRKRYITLNSTARGCKWANQRPYIYFFFRAETDPRNVDTRTGRRSIPVTNKISISLTGQSVRVNVWHFSVDLARKQNLCVPKRSETVKTLPNNNVSSASCRIVPRTTVRRAEKVASFYLFSFVDLTPSVRARPFRGPLPSRSNSELVPCRNVPRRLAKRSGTPNRWRMPQRHLRYYVPSNEGINWD